MTEKPFMDKYPEFEGKDLDYESDDPYCGVNFTQFQQDVSPDLIFGDKTIKVILDKHFIRKYNEEDFDKVNHTLIEKQKVKEAFDNFINNGLDLKKFKRELGLED